MTTSDVPVGIPIHTSDRIQFKKCRRAWDFSSKLRRNRTAIKLPVPLDFGTAIHAGLEVWYEPQWWDLVDREMIYKATIAKFHTTMQESKQTYFNAAKLEGWDSDEDRDEFEKNLIMGEGMLRDYIAWAAPRDKDIRPIGVEVPFEVPIRVPEGVILAGTSFLNVDGFLHVVDQHYDPTPVVYRGRIDLLMEDNSGHQWIADHKTVGRDLDGQTEFLELDEQCTSYGWAYWETTGVRPRGIIYNQLWKGVAGPPAVLDRAYKGRWLSTNRQQATTYDQFIDTAKREDPGGLEQGLYEDYLTYLKAEGKVYFRRTQVPRGPQELLTVGTQVAYEAMDMLNKPFIYPAPDMWKCKWCMFRAACLASNDGSDVEWMLQNQYKERV